MSSTLRGKGSAPAAASDRPDRPDQPDPSPTAGRPRRSATARLRAPVLEARGGPETQRRVRDSAGLLSAAAMRRLDDDLEWYRALPAEDRSWVGLVAQAGITAFVTWFAEPTRPPHGVGDIFAAAPPELTRSISLQHTLQLVRVVVDVVESHSDRLAAPGDEREVREAVLRYSREVAFSAAEVVVPTMTSVDPRPLHPSAAIRERRASSTSPRTRASTTSASRRASQAPRTSAARAYTSAAENATSRE